MQEFDRASQDGPDEQALLAYVRDVATHGALLSFAVMGTATCLMATLGDKAGHDQDIVNAITPDLYESCLRLVPDILPWEDSPGEGKASNSANLIKNCTPERAWPLVLCNAVYQSLGLSAKGYIPGCDKPVFYADEDFPPEFRARQMDVVLESEEQLRGFIERGAEAVRAHVNYPYPINPVWLFMVVEEAQERNLVLADDLNTWFAPCFDEVLIRIHDARRESGDNSRYTKSYN